MVTVNYKDVAERVLWTFVQAFLSAIAVAGVGWVSLGLWKSAALAGGAAVIALLKNVSFQAFGVGSADRRTLR